MCEAGCGAVALGKIESENWMPYFKASSNPFFMII